MMRETEIEKKVHYMGKAPEDFFTDVIEIPMFGPGSEERPPQGEGYCYLRDERKEHGFHRYAKPTELSKKWSREYPLGAKLAGWEVTVWPDGRILTTITNVSSCHLRFRFDAWGGLTTLPEDGEGV